jgi:hypothetical protein
MNLSKIHEHKKSDSPSGPMAALEIANVRIISQNPSINQTKNPINPRNIKKWKGKVFVAHHLTLTSRR